RRAGSPSRPASRSELSVLSLASPGRTDRILRFRGHTMSKTCEMCGKHTTFGNTIARRGMAKYLGGVGVKKTGVSRRPFEANIQVVRVQYDGHVRTAKICTRCIKSGKVVKRQKREIPDAVRLATKAKLDARKPEARRAARRARAQERKAKQKAA